MELQKVGKLIETLQKISPEKQEKILIFAQGVAAGVSAEKSRPQEIGIVAEEQLVEVVKPSPPDKVA